MKRVGIGKRDSGMIYIDERKARIAGQVAAIDAICEFADRLSARHVATLCHRSSAIQRPHAAAIANRSAR